MSCGSTLCIKVKFNSVKYAWPFFWQSNLSRIKFKPFFPPALNETSPAPTTAIQLTCAKVTSQENWPKNTIQLKYSLQGMAAMIFAVCVRLNKIVVRRLRMMTFDWNWREKVFLWRSFWRRAVVRIVFQVFGGMMDLIWLSFWDRSQEILWIEDFIFLLLLNF